jgi:predicted Zn-dependent peptidase
MEIHKLANGMKIIFYPRPCSTLSTFGINVNVGSDDETFKRGIAHVVEHLVFTRTASMSQLDIGKEIESIGGDINAETGETCTVFYATVPVGNEKKAIDIISDMILNPVFDEKDIRKEKNVVLTEKAEGNSSIPDTLDEETFKMMTGRSDVIGTEQGISSITRIDAINFHERWYVPNNMSAIVVGPRILLDDISSKFSSIRPSKLPERRKFDVIVPRNSTKTINKHASRPYMMITYATPGYTTADGIALDVVASILGRAMSGRLFNEARIKRGLFYHAHCEHHVERTYGMLSIDFSARKDYLEECKNIIIDQVSKVDEIDAIELASSKRYIAGELSRRMEKTESAAETIGYFDSIGNAAMVDYYMGMINDVSQDYITKAKKKYLDKGYVQVIVK